MLETVELFNIKFWVAFQLAVDLVLVCLVVYFLKALRSGSSGGEPQESGARIIGMLEPLLHEANTTAASFETQLKEKRRLINRLNDSLEGRIIGLNMLLNRTDTLIQSEGPDRIAAETGHVFDQQQAILEQFNKGCDAATAARALSIPRKEVEMVYELKRKFLKLKQDISPTDHA